MLTKNERAVEKSRGRLDLAKDLLHEIDHPSIADKNDASQILAFVRGMLREEIKFRQADIAQRTGGR